MLLFLYRSDADKWTRDYKMVNSSYDSKRCLYLSWEIMSCDYKDYLCVTWLPMVNNFMSGMCKNEYKMAPLDLREKIHYAQMRFGLPCIQWPPVFKITGDEQRKLKLAHDHDRVGRQL